MSHELHKELAKLNLEEEDEKDCIICCETFNNFEHAAIECPKCGTCCCKTCYKRQFLIWNKPRCMNEECKHPFERDFLISKFPKNWIDTTLKDHRKAVMLDIEKAMLPAASAAIERKRNAEKNIEKSKVMYRIATAINKEFGKKWYEAQNRYNKKISNYVKERLDEPEIYKLYIEQKRKGNHYGNRFVTNLQQEARNAIPLEAKLYPLPEEILVEALAEEITCTQRDLNESMTAADWQSIVYRDINDQSRRLFQQAKHVLDNIHIENVEGEFKEKRDVFHFRCPSGDCKGYLNKDYSCNVCSCKCCKKCVVEIKGKHECKQEDLDSIKMIRDETKPCPSCSTRISKIAGCSQMFCTNCNIAFDWKTGEVDNGPVHNPHYYEWLAKNGRNDDRHLRQNPDFAINMCRDPYDSLYRWARGMRKLKETIEYDVLYDMIRVAIHFQRTVIPVYRVDRFKDTLNLRMRYITNDINERNWKIQLFKQLKVSEFNQHITNLITMFCDMINHTIIEMSDRKLEDTYEANHQILKDTCNTIKTLIEYWDTHSMALCKQYDYVYHFRLQIRPELGRTIKEILNLEELPKEEKTKKAKKEDPCPHSRTAERDEDTLSDEEKDAIKEAIKRQMKK